MEAKKKYMQYSVEVDEHSIVITDAIDKKAILVKRLIWSAVILVLLFPISAFLISAVERNYSTIGVAGIAVVALVSFIILEALSTYENSKFVFLIGFSGVKIIKPNVTKFLNWDEIKLYGTASDIYRKGRRSNPKASFIYFSSEKIEMQELRNALANGGAYDKSKKDILLFLPFVDDEEFETIKSVIDKFIEKHSLFTEK